MQIALLDLFLVVTSYNHLQVVTTWRFFLVRPSYKVVTCSSSPITSTWVNIRIKYFMRERNIGRINILLQNGSKKMSLSWNCVPYWSFFVLNQIFYLSYQKLPKNKKDWLLIQRRINNDIFPRKSLSYWRLQINNGSWNLEVTFDSFRDIPIFYISIRLLTFSNKSDENTN